MNKHVASVHERKIKCNICDASFASNQSIKIHIDSVHEGEKPFNCNICDASFTEKGNLNKHVASVHEGKKPFTCKFCGLLRKHELYELIPHVYSSCPFL